jgi:ATP-dependent RNA helicase DeaD
LTTFSSLGISEPILKALDKMGFEEATPIQAETIPSALEGKDVLGQAQTGTGKTAAFGIPMISKIDRSKRQIQGLVIAPTRELAIQVGEELHRLGQFKGIKTLPVYGGQHMERQIRALREGPHIVVATPGRLLDHIRRKTINFNSVHTAVLDEADEMLNMGFIDDIREILSSIPEERQTLLFSATMPKEIRDIGTKLMKDPTEVKVKSKEMTVTNIDQSYIEVQERQKFDTLSNLLDIDEPKLAIIFGRTKKRVDEVTEGLQARGFRAEGIHGDLTQGKRMSVLNKFKNGRVEVLVATDVAARGLDISGVTHVYNFDIPQDPESYVHRIGRTGRAGKGGQAVSFITPREVPHLHLIEKTTKSKIARKTAPTNDEAAQGQQQIAIEKMMRTIESKDLQAYNDKADELINQFDAQTVVAAALKMLTKERRNAPVRITSIAPISVKGNFKDKKKYRGGGSRGGDRRNSGGGRNNGGGKSRSRNYQGQSKRSSGGYRGKRNNENN